MPKSNKRPHKGKSLLQFADDYTMVDIETTGFDPTYDEIIEIGAVKVRNNKIVDEYESLVVSSFGLSSFITELTGITNQMLSSSPTLENVLPDFFRFIDGELIIGHNINFDINFLYDSFIKTFNTTLTNDFICTMRLSRWLFKDLNSHSLKSLISEFNLPERTLHRASSDCYYTKELFDYMKNHVVENKIDINELFTRSSSYYSKKYDLSKITTENKELDSAHSLFGKNIVFTGVLEKMVRKEAAQLAVNLGAICQNGVNRQTNILVLGNNDYCPSIKDGISGKQKKAQEYILKGQDLIILSENVFYDMVLDG